MKNYLKSFFAIIFTLSFPLAVSAVEIIPPGCREGNAEVSICGLNEVMQLFINIYNVGIQYVAVVTMLFLVIGGFVLLISGGRSNMVDVGKKILVGAFIGMFIVLTSYLLVRIIQVNILDANPVYVVTNDVQCSGKKDGTECSLGEGSGKDFKGNHVCVSGVCSVISECDWKNRNTPGITYDIDSSKVNVQKNCWSKSFCNTSEKIDSGLCPGSKDNVCCYISKEKLTPKPVNNLPKPIPVSP